MSLQHIGDVLLRQRPYAPQQWQQDARQWLRLEDLAPTHGVGQADVGRVVVLEGTGFWVCVCVEQGGVDRIHVTEDNLVRRCSLGAASFGVVQDHMRFVGPVHRARRCEPEGIPPGAVVLVAVTTVPRIQGRDVSPVVPNNMWRQEDAATMCAASHGHAMAVRMSSNSLHCGSRAWYWVVAAQEPNSSALRLFDCRGVQELVLRPADLEALHLGTLGSEGNTAVSLRGTLVGVAALRYRGSYGGDTFHLVMPGRWRPGPGRLRAPSGP